jgi:glycine dehydrogenase subunit 1
VPGYVPHTTEDQQAMLETIGLETMADLFQSIPEGLRLRAPLDLPAGLSEPEALRLLDGLARQNMDAGPGACFRGAGVYRHYTPSLVPVIMQRGEFLTSYTPYQPERSQGMLQTIYEFQSLVCRLLGLEAANASMYDGATALAEAVVMAASVTGRNRVLIPDTVQPSAIAVCRTYAQGQGIVVEVLPHQNGRTSVEDARARLGEDVAAVVIPQPNFFGLIEDAAALSAAAKESGALVIGLVNPIAMALLAPPGEWPADIAVAEGQSLGLPMNFGGPLVGLFACSKEHVRQMPGRIVGATVDASGDRAYTLTLQTREQHIRREKASSNICTNQALCALGATVYMEQLGKHGLRAVATLSLQRAHQAFDAITALPGWEPAFDGPFFHEFALRAPAPIAEINARLAAEGITGPLDLSVDYPGLPNTALFCCTELIQPEDIQRLVDVLSAD